MTEAETVFIMAEVFAEREPATKWARAAEWFAMTYSLNDLEAAAAMAFDPPAGDPSLPGLAILMGARTRKRRATPASPEVEDTDPDGFFDVDPGLYRAVLDAFEDVIED